jgi:hypothetical protein
VVGLRHHEQSRARIEVPVFLPCHSLGVSEGNGLALGWGTHEESVTCGISAADAP